MATEVGTAYVTLLPSAKGFASKMQSELGGELGAAGAKTGEQYSTGVTKTAGSRLKSGFGKIFSGIGSLAAPVAAFATVATVTDVLKSSIAGAEQVQKVNARTTSVIKSMGNAAHISASGVKDLADSIEKKTAVDHLDIQSGANLLLTFKNIQNTAGKGNDIFDQTTQLMTDMSTAMGQSTKSSAIQLGKALNDPIKGMTALSRVGVSFTAQQKSQITALENSGKTMAAQKIILKEVKGEFGGAAAAMATPADHAKVAWHGFEEQMGAVLLPLVDKIMTAFAEALPVILDWASAFGRYVGPVLKKVIGWVKQFIDQFQQSGKQTQSTRDDIIGSLQDILGVVRVVVKIIEFLWAHFGSTLMTYVVGTFKNIITIIEAALKIIHGVLDIVMGLLTGDWSRAWQGVKEVLSGVWTIIKTLIRQAMLYIRTLLKIGWKAIKLIFTAALKGIWALIKWYFRTWVRMFLALPKLLAKALAALAPLLGQVFRAAWARASQWVQQGIANVVNAVRALPGKIRALGGLLAAAGRAVIQAFVNGLQNAPGVVSNIAGNVWDALKSLVNSAIDKINGALDFTISLPGPDVHINAGHIPHLARGARATSGTLAMIGEGREPETVLPDSMLSGLLGRAAAAGGANRLRLVVDGWEFNAYVDARADGRVSTAGNLAAEGRRASWPSRR